MSRQEKFVFRSMLQALIIIISHIMMYIQSHALFYARMDLYNNIHTHGLRGNENV